MSQKVNQSVLHFWMFHPDYDGEDALLKSIYSRLVQNALNGFV